MCTDVSPLGGGGLTTPIGSRPDLSGHGFVVVGAVLLVVGATVRAPLIGIG